MTVVETRFAGGPIVVETLEASETHPAIVEVNLPGLTVAVFPHEAIALALALAEHVPLVEVRALFDALAKQVASRNAASTARPLRRHTTVDDGLRGIDG